MVYWQIVKKLVTISLILLFILYQIGFVAVYWVTKTQIDNHWHGTVSYDQPLKKVSIPLSVPYWTDQENYRPVDGLLELDGIPYRKVLQKYEKDTIHVLVVRDTMTEKLEDVTRDLITTQNSTQDKPNKNTGIYSFLKNDLQVEDSFEWNMSEIAIFLTHNSGYNFSMCTHFISIDTPPPQV